ncbi:hypothetical protein TVNIR_2016 [Thioalkalivibrio nitratireducens DSM 14787]|uniref:Uncharacterized protein n=1 Tax=Thioalkalivibrio nitratireducens (strain DSM 14787 / UNIQEM 213 / ALEN2) TaxID=1255043 RepID=L0DXE5_THIND|nr:DsrE family protein [Thioalkalivibrio nitratireducens]AGA33677.1 hypothetical protein TVNIR_2016 [Thioalkalivibrio nitratireducens DSM 14787]
MPTRRSLLFMLALLLAAPSVLADAGGPADPVRVALQLSDHDPIRQSMVLSVANNLVNHYGADHVDVEVVAFGPGLTLLRDTSQFAQRVTALSESQGVRFSYCEITVDSMEQREGQRPRLLPVAQATPSGAVRIIDLVAEGYTHIAP